MEDLLAVIIYIGTTAVVGCLLGPHSFFPRASQIQAEYGPPWPHLVRSRRALPAGLFRDARLRHCHTGERARCAKCAAQQRDICRRSLRAARSAAGKGRPCAQLPGRSARGTDLPPGCERPDARSGHGTAPCGSPRTPPGSAATTVRCAGSRACRYWSISAQLMAPTWRRTQIAAKLPNERRAGHALLSLKPGKPVSNNCHITQRRYFHGNQQQFHTLRQVRTLLQPKTHDSCPYCREGAPGPTGGTVHPTEKAPNGMPSGGVPPTEPADRTYGSQPSGGQGGFSPTSLHTVRSRGEWAAAISSTP